jgi:hypothetical protein
VRGMSGSRCLLLWPNDQLKLQLEIVSEERFKVGVEHSISRALCEASRLLAGTADIPVRIERVSASNQYREH